MRLHTPWFYITYTIKYEDDSELRHILLVSQVNDLKQFKNDKDTHIDSVYLVSPSHLNKSPHWQMEPIQKILVGLEPECDQYRYIFILQNGNRYFDSGLCNKESELRSLTTLFEKEE